jgi:hypothetical protein
MTAAGFAVNDTVNMLFGSDTAVRYRILYATAGMLVLACTTTAAALRSIRNLDTVLPLDQAHDQNTDTG